MPSAASLRATWRSSPARTVDAGRARMAPCGVITSRSAQNIRFGGQGWSGSTVVDCDPVGAVSLDHRGVFVTRPSEVDHVEHLHPVGIFTGGVQFLTGAVQQDRFQSAPLRVDATIGPNVADFLLVCRHAWRPVVAAVGCVAEGATGFIAGTHDLSGCQLSFYQRHPEVGTDAQYIVVEIIGGVMQAAATDAFDTVTEQ